MPTKKRIPDQWAKRLNADMAFAVEMLKERGELMPFFVARCGDGSHVVMATPWGGDSDKQMMLMAVKAYCVAHDVTSISQITEAWVAVARRHSGESDEEFRSRVDDSDLLPPSQREDRREMVFVSVCWRGEHGLRNAIRAREIVRDDIGKATGVAAEGGFDDIDALAGRMIEIIPERTPTTREREMASAVIDALGTVGFGIQPIERQH